APTPDFVTESRFSARKCTFLVRDLHQNDAMPLENGCLLSCKPLKNNKTLKWHGCCNGVPRITTIRARRKMRYEKERSVTGPCSRRCRRGARHRDGRSHGQYWLG